MTREREPSLHLIDDLAAKIEEVNRLIASIFAAATPEIPMILEIRLESCTAGSVRSLAGVVREKTTSSFQPRVAVTASLIVSRSAPPTGWAVPQE